LCYGAFFLTTLDNEKSCNSSTLDIAKRKLEENISKQENVFEACNDPQAKFADELDVNVSQDNESVQPS
jgi:hypothetical protein